MSGAGESPSLKTCSNIKCPRENPQPLKQFNKDKNRKDGLFPWCKACVQMNNRRYYANNGAQVREQVKDYALGNKEKVLASKRAYHRRERGTLLPKKRAYYQRNRPAHITKVKLWVEKNPEKRREIRRAWDKRNPENRRLNKRRRRARLFNAKGSHTVADVLAKLELQGGLCYYCHKELEAYHVDHKIPIAKGGTDWPANICCACPNCNFTKQAKSFWSFLAMHRGHPPFNRPGLLLDPKP